MPSRLRLRLDDRVQAVEITGRDVRLLDSDRSLLVHPGTDGRFTVHDGVTRVEAVGAIRGTVAWVSIDGCVFRVHLGSQRQGAAEQYALTPPMSATVVRIAVATGEAVRQGDLLIALEAMKMELPIRAPRDGVVRAIHCGEGDIVQPGTILIDI